jgi:hypothetical protein
MANGGWKNILGERWVTRASIYIASGVSSITTRRFFGGGKYNLIALGGSYNVTGATASVSRSFLTPRLISTTTITLSTSATPGAQNIVIPPTAQLVVVHFSAFNASSQSLSSLTSTGTSAFTIVQDTGTEISGVAYAVVTSTGAKTITPVWSGAPGEGPLFFISYIEGINTSNYFRDAAASGLETSGSSASVTINTSTTDLVIAHNKSDTSLPATISGFTSQNTQNNNLEFGRLQTANTPGSSTTTITGTSTNWDGIAAISIKAPPASGSYILTANGGSYTLSGGTAVLLRTKNLIVSGGSYSLVGQNANLVKGRVLTSQGGSYTVGGASATLLRSKRIVASGGAYSYTGQTATLSRSKYLIAQGGAYNLTGQSVVITWTSGSTNYTLICQGGSYTLLGASANVNRNRNLTAQSGNYSLSGAAANIYRSKYINVVGGIYNLSGSSATITWTTVGGAVYPPVGSVLLGVTYGPTGTEYTGTLDIGKKFRIDIATGHIVMILDGDKVMSL